MIETMGDDFDEQDHDWDSVHQDHPALINDVAFPDFHEELADLMPDFSDHGAANPMANSTSQGEIAICWGGLLAGNDASCTPGFVAGRGHFKNHVRETSLPPSRPKYLRKPLTNDASHGCPTVLWLLPRPWRASTVATNSRPRPSSARAV